MRHRVVQQLARDEARRAGLIVQAPQFCALIAWSASTVSLLPVAPTMNRSIRVGVMVFLPGAAVCSKPVYLAPSYM